MDILPAHSTRLLTGALRVRSAGYRLILATGTVRRGISNSSGNLNGWRLNRRRWSLCLPRQQGFRFRSVLIILLCRNLSTESGSRNRSRLPVSTGLSRDCRHGRSCFETPWLVSTENKRPVEDYRPGSGENLTPVYLSANHCTSSSVPHILRLLPPVLSCCPIAYVSGRHGHGWPSRSGQCFLHQQL